MQGSAWSSPENTAVVNSYLRMLLCEWNGIPYNKSSERRALSPMLSKRTDSSIEMKHRNISAILLAYGIPPIYGYKPLPNIQISLEAAVLEGIGGIENFGDLAMQSMTSIGMNSDVPALEPAEIPSVTAPWKSARLRRQVISNDLLAAEAQSGAVHLMALKAVALHEKRTLAASERSDLAAAVEIRKNDYRTGTGLVISRSISGSLRTILVKATNSLAEFPFMVSSDEVDLSLDASSGFRLYRVYGLRHRPGFYKLRGSLRAAAQLTASEYTVLPRS
ncbi:DUF3883 domain-containing protein [Micrococcaceae bacterium Sec5.8]